MSQLYEQIYIRNNYSNYRRVMAGTHIHFILLLPLYIIGMCTNVFLRFTYAFVVRVIFMVIAVRIMCLHGKLYEQ